VVTETETVTAVFPKTKLKPTENEKSRTIRVEYINLPDCVGLVPSLDIDSDGSQSAGCSASSAVHRNSETETRTVKPKLIIKTSTRHH